jgi:hypothetical protein
MDCSKIASLLDSFLWAGDDLMALAPIFEKLSDVSCLAMTFGCAAAASRSSTMASDVRLNARQVKTTIHADNKMIKIDNKTPVGVIATSIPTGTSSFTLLILKQDKITVLSQYDKSSVILFSLKPLVQLYVSEQFWRIPY